MSRAREIRPARFLGVDLSAAPKQTYACVLSHHGDRLDGEITGDCDDVRLKSLGRGCLKIGIDAPFGWPAQFVEALQAHRSRQAWPVDEAIGTEGVRASLRYRATDRIATQTRRPLSVSTDRLGVTAMRCAHLLDSWGKRPVDRTGKGRFVEVYPAGALTRWDLPAEGYKDAAVSARKKLLANIKMALPSLYLPTADAKLCRESHDALDALIAALVARAAWLKLTDPPPRRLRDLAEEEGWIHLPVRGTLPLLARAREDLRIDPRPAVARAFRASGGKTDRRGYAAKLETSLMSHFPPETVSAVQNDLVLKGGSELTARKRAPAKFLAAHSSAALAANAFGPFLGRTDTVPLGGRSYAGERHLEAECPTGISRTPPTLDFLVDDAREVLAVESKFTEPFAKHEAEFRDAYAKAILDLHPTWQAEYRRLVEDPNRYRHLAAHQLVKHCLGLRRTFGRRRKIALVYLYWEPSDAGDLAPCAIHRAEIAEFVRRVSDPHLRFVPMAYSQLWSAWARRQSPPWLQRHARALQRRYSFPVGA